MRPKSEQEIWNENVANMRLKLAPKKDFERLLNESYDPIANAMRRHPKLTEEEAEAMAKAFDEVLPVLEAQIKSPTFALQGFIPIVNSRGRLSVIEWR